MALWSTGTGIIPFMHDALVCTPACVRVTGTASVKWSRSLLLTLIEHRLPPAALPRAGGGPGGAVPVYLIILPAMTSPPATEMYRPSGASLCVIVRQPCHPVQEAALDRVDLIPPARTGSYKL